MVAPRGPVDVPSAVTLKGKRAPASWQGCEGGAGRADGTRNALAADVVNGTL